MSGAKLLYQVTLVLWAVVATLCLMALIGMTGLLSSLVGHERVEMAVDVVFFVFVVVFAVLLSRLFCAPQSRMIKILAFFTPLTLFFVFLVFL